MPMLRYKKFLLNYGASYRTKNLPPRFYWLNPLLNALGRGPKVPSSYRKFPLPRTSKLPREFIRLCPWEGAYLFSVARRARLGIVEIGRFNGGSTFLLAYAAPDVPIYSIDCAPINDERLSQLFKENGVGDNVNLIVGDSQKGKFPSVGSYDFLFIDGDHSYEGCSADIANWYPRLARNGHMLFHDSWLGAPGVQDAIADFIDVHPEADVLVNPFMGRAYYENPHGSLAHLLKRGRSAADGEPHNDRPANPSPSAA